MREPYTKEFFKTYEHGWRHYVKGEWTKAKEQFEKVLEILPDKPSQQLLAYMEGKNFVAPADWNGIKPFTE